jgi:hypothetical protein
MFTMFQKCPDVQRLQKIIMHLQILKPRNVKAKNTQKNSPSNMEIFHFKKREHEAPHFQKTLSSAESEVFRYIR